MTAVPDLAAWLREVVTADREFWSKRAADLLPDVEREGEYWYFEARERAARCEAELAILDEHASDGDQVDPECTGCAARHPEYCECDTAAPWPCRTVRLLGSGYRHRAGYDSSCAP